MEIALTLNQRTLIVSLSGELDHHGAEQIRTLIERAITEKDVKNLIFDFSALSFMDSSGIGMIIGRYKLIKSIGGGVALVCTNPRMKKLVTMSGLSRLISVYSTVDQALSEVKGA
ncbi:MAG: anti-sigma F factor antagonist [Clostridia bacterium]|nr:anti-sigma F factor antagonist [Clostridia bacterium]